MELIKSLIQFQSEVGSIPKNKENPFHHNKYADLASIIETVRSVLSKNGLFISQTTKISENHTILVTTLWHTSGQSIESEYLLQPVKPDPQAMGSAITYARRYSILAILCLAAEDDPTDDDGNCASQPQPQKQSYPSNGNGNGKPKERERCPKCNEPKLIRDKFEPEKKYCLDCSVKFDSNMKEIIKEPVHHSEQTTFLEDETPEHNPDPTEKYPF